MDKALNKMVERDAVISGSNIYGTEEILQMGSPLKLIVCSVVKVDSVNNV